MGKTKVVEKRFHFTKAAIDAVPIPPKKRSTYYDDEVRELGLLVQPTGHRSFFWFRKVQGRPTWKTIGKAEDVSLENARNKAREYSTKAAQWKLSEFRDDNPLEDHRRGEPTFEDLVKDYIERHVKKHAKRPEKSERDTNSTVNLYLASWKSRRLSMIRRKDVIAMHTSIGESLKKNKTPKHHMANRVIQLVRALFNWARTSELWKGENPAEKIQLYNEPKRTRFLQPDEAPRLFAALKKAPNPDVPDFVNISIWTGARKSDVLAMRWDQISLPDNRWTIPDPKNREPHTIPLTPEASDILKKRLRNRQGSNPWVFPSHGKSGHVADLKGAWKKVLKAANIKDFRHHDNRRTQGSWQAGLGTSSIIIGKSLGHKSQSATAIYAQLNLDPVREAMTAANKALMVAMKKKVPKQLENTRG